MTEDLGMLFHRLKNQLGIILANAELIEAKSADEPGRVRAGQVVLSVLDAMATAREIRLRFRGDLGQESVTQAKKQSNG